VCSDYPKDEIFKISQRNQHLICIFEKEKEKKSEKDKKFGNV
jgi:hypothetical protein